MNYPPRVLLVDDNPSDRILARRELENEFPDLRVEEASTAPGFDQALEAGPYDLVITDYHLSWSDGIAIFRAVKARYPQSPVIMFTGTGSEEIAVAAMKSGLNDYVIKNSRHLKRLSDSARAAIAQVESERWAARIDQRLHELMNRLNVGLFRADADGRLLEANPALLRVLRCDPATGVPSLRLDELPLDAEAAGWLLDPFKDEEAARTREVEWRRADGTATSVSVTITRAVDAASARCIDGMVEQITERRRADAERLTAIQEHAARIQADHSRRRAVRIARAGQILASSLDDTATIPEFMRLLVPALADGCVLQLVDEDGTTRLADRVYADPEVAERAEKLHRLYPLDPNGDGPVARVLREGKPYLATEVSDSMLQAAAHDADHLAGLRQLNLGSFMIVPIRVRKRTLGILSLMSLESGRRYTPNDLPFTEDLAHCVALAIDNARLYKAAQEVEQRFLQLAENIPQFFWLAGPRVDEFLYVSPAYETIWGRSCASLTDRPESFFESIHPEDREYALDIVERQRRGESTQARFRIIRPDGSVRWIWDRAAPVLSPEGEILSVAGVAEDITERKRLDEELLLQAEALVAADRRKDEFLAMLAHELRNPLAPILNTLEMVRRGDPDKGVPAAALDLLERQTHNIARLLDDLLDVSRITRGKIELRTESLDLVDLIRTVFDDHYVLLKQAELTASLELVEGPVWIDGDAIRLAQVLGNLLRNAIKFTDPGGRVGARMAVDPMQRRVDITLWDTGDGIEALLLPHLFEAFKQGDRTLPRNRSGLGLGLTLVRELVKLHGGDVDARSDGVGRGAAFTIRLPLGRPPVHPVSKSHGADGISKALRILMIEDDPEVATSLQGLLQLFGHEVRVAHTAADGVATAREWRPEVLLCDIGLPDAEGYAVAEQLRNSREMSRTHLIALTGYGQEADRRRALAAGFDIHLAKPVRPRALEQLLISLPERP